MGIDATRTGSLIEDYYDFAIQRRLATDSEIFASNTVWLIYEHYRGHIALEKVYRNWTLV